MGPAAATRGGDEVPVLRTARTVLRGWRPEDRAPFAAMNADPRVMAHYPATLSREESDALVDRLEAAWRRDGVGLWALEHEGRFVGYVGLAPLRPDLPAAPAVEVGWRLAAPAWGRGLATEAARAALHHAFPTAGLAEVVSVTAVGNTRSRAVMERIGMTRDAAGDFDHPGVPVGSPLRRHVLYRLGRAAWERAAAPG